MKILIEESVLRQALEAIDDSYATLPEGLTLITALRSTLDAAEKVEPVVVFAGFCGAVPMFEKFPDSMEIGTDLYTHPAPAVPEELK